MLVREAAIGLKKTCVANAFSAQNKEIAKVMNMRNTLNLYRKVERKKIALTMMAERYGRTDPRVLAASRELDMLIVEVQRLRLTGNRFSPAMAAAQTGQLSLIV